MELSVDVADRRARVAAVTERMATIKASKEGLVVYGGFSLVSGRTPVQVAQAWLELFARRASAVITNIAGPRELVSLAGTPLTGFMLWVPTSGSIGVGLSIVSYAGRLMAVDPNVVPDAEQLLQALRDERWRSPHWADTGGHNDLRATHGWTSGTMGRVVVDVALLRGGTSSVSSMRSPGGVT